MSWCTHVRSDTSGAPYSVYAFLLHITLSTSWPRGPPTFMPRHLNSHTSLVDEVPLPPHTYRPSRYLNPYYLFSEGSESTPLKISINPVLFIW